VKKGCIDFDFPEAEIVLYKDGSPKEIKARDRDAASLMIEDFMILANETVAKEFDSKEIPFMYRTHGAPDADRVMALNDYTQTIGINIRPKNVNISPKEIQDVLKRIKGRPEEKVINHMVLRAMQKAKYNTECEGHFGLASEHYCHFTSPIRRYPDLQIHRIIKEYLHGDLNKKRMKHYKQLLPERAERCSVLERRADEAERE
jgi:ribonuclease R